MSKDSLEDFFIQKNELKNIGIYLVNSDKILDLNHYFNNGVLYSKYLSLENTDVKFFDITDLPLIKKKQKYLTQEIITHLQEL